MKNIIIILGIILTISIATTYADPKYTCSPQNLLIIINNTATAYLNGNAQAIAYWTNIAEEYQKECGVPPTSGGTYNDQIKKQQCQSLWTQFHRCETEWKRRLGSPNEILYTCQRPTCSKWE